jgi:Ca2+-binding EF-hand superfamily protein
MDRTKLLSDGNLNQAFKAFDVDGNGSISIDELKSTLGGHQIKDFIWQKLIEEVDEDGNGEIDLDEFKTMMRKLVNS